ncbi:hypothetical protein DL89DRAFT_80626 [Linderina pennispora]|uniref:Uncharacterized protein n=1 Tax=Linderina pennispora TaxID=61395 RepID=A0A1Y1WGI1_9FUNG|nr:uncharacterized protein DL89DRAFT_80626 [Linderina pennispora]ORX72643.1 hypothetical protein DL89DRAFT_80626 [Linderina pennispora]
MACCSFRLVGFHFILFHFIHFLKRIKRISFRDKVYLHTMLASAEAAPVSQEHSQDADEMDCVPTFSDKTPWKSFIIILDHPYDYCKLD